MYALNCPRGVSGFSLSVLLLYVCTASLCLSYFLPVLLLLYVYHRLYDLSVASSFLLGVYCLYTYVTVYMFTSPPSAGSPHRPAICRLVYALDCPRGVSGFSLSILLLYVCIDSLCLSPSI